jgi:hypothetical protein
MSNTISNGKTKQVSEVIKGPFRVLPGRLAVKTIFYFFLIEKIK